MNNTNLSTGVEIKETYFNERVFNHIEKMMQVFIKSKALPQWVKNEAQGIFAMQAAFEMGFKPVETFRYLYMINGSLSIFGKAALVKMRDAGFVVDYKDESDEACTVIVTRDKEKYTATVKFIDAQNSGYTAEFARDAQGNKKKDANGNYITSLKVGWRKGQNRKLKLRYMGLTEILNTYIPEVLGSVTGIKEIVEDYPESEDESNNNIVKGADTEGINNFIDKVQKEKAMKEEDNKSVLTHAVKTPIETTSRPSVEAQVPLDVEVPVSEPVSDRIAPELVKERKKFFALADEIGIDAEEAKEAIKNQYQVQSFMDISLLRLRTYNRAMQQKLDDRKLQQEKGVADEQQ